MAWPQLHRQCSPAAVSCGVIAQSFLFLRIILAIALASASALARASAAPEPKKDEASAPVSEALSSMPTRTYVHQWLRMPQFTAVDITSGDAITVAPRKGRALVVVFLASWCEPCQEIVPQLAAVERHFAAINVDFVYVFAHDSKDDARGFMQEFKLRGGLIANHETLKAYHNPELPSVYVGDRHTWLAARYLNLDQAKLQNLQGFLQKITAY